MMSPSAPLKLLLRTTFLLLVYLSFLNNNASKSVLMYVSLVEMEQNAAAKEGKLPPKMLQNLTELAHAYTHLNTTLTLFCGRK